MTSPARRPSPGHSVPGCTVLVLGGTGQLGPLLCRELVDHGFAVHAFNRGRRPERLPREAILWRGDRRRAEDLRVLDAVPADVVIDCAGWFPETLPELLGRFTGRAQRAVLVSSAAVYAPGGEDPRIEDSPVGSHPVWGRYGEIKRRAEAALREAARQGLPGVALRPAYLCLPGPQSREARLAVALADDRPIPIAGDGSTCIQHTAAADLVAACVRLAAGPPPPSDRYNIAGERLWTVRGWIEAFARHLGVEPRFQEVSPDDPSSPPLLYPPADVRVDCTRLRAELGIDPDSPKPQVLEEAGHEERRPVLSRHP